MKARQLLLALALAATLATAFWPQPEEDVVEAVAHSGGKGAPATRRPTTPAETPPRLGALRADLFPAQTWQPPPPPSKRVEMQPPAPLPPPLPFQYLGHWREGGKDVIFLAQGNQVLQVQVGDALAGWHLDQATDAVLTFTWTALNMQQILRISP